VGFQFPVVSAPTAIDGQADQSQIDGGQAWKGAGASYSGAPIIEQTLSDSIQPRRPDSSVWKEGAVQVHCNSLVPLMAQITRGMAGARSWSKAPAGRQGRQCGVDLGRWHVDIDVAEMAQGGMWIGQACDCQALEYGDVDTRRSPGVKQLREGGLYALQPDPGPGKIHRAFPVQLGTGCRGVMSPGCQIERACGGRRHRGGPAGQQVGLQFFSTRHG